MKKRILSVLIAVVMLIGMLPTTVFAASATNEIHWAVVQKDSDVILYLGNTAHVMQTGETLYADGAQGTDDMVLEYYFDQPYEDWYTEITKVVIESEIQPTSCAYWFYDLFRCTEMDLRLLNTGSVTSMKAMFKYCSSMTTLTWDTSKFTTANVTTMESMFYNCEKLTSLDLSHFNTSNVTNMLDMFYRCTKLETLDLSSFDTSDVTDMAFMFYACYELAYLDLSNFDLSSIAASSTKSLFSGAEILTLKTPKINPHADAFSLSNNYSDEQGNVYTALPVSESAEGVKTLYRNYGIQYFLYDSTGGEGNPERYAYNKAYSITLTVPQRAGFVFDGWEVDGPEGVTLVGNTLTIPQHTTGWVYIDTLWKPYTVSVSGGNAPYTATIDPLRDDVTYSWHEYSFGSNEITDESAIYISEYSSGTYDPETGWTPDQFEALYIFFDVSLKSGDTVMVTFAEDVDVEAAVLMDGEWEPIFGEAQADNVILFTIPEDGIYTLMTDEIDTTAKAIHTGRSVSNTAAFTGATLSTGEIGTQYVAKATFTDGGKEVIAYSDPFTYAEHIVTFDYGTLGSETKTVLNGKTVTPPAPVFAGKVLVGWYTDSSFATEFNFSDAITANTTIYAKFTDYEGDKTELNNKIDDAKAELQGKIDAVESALAGKADAATLAQAITDLNTAKTNIQTLLEQIDDYADADTALKAELITKIETADNLINTAISDLTSRVETLESELAAAKSDISTNASEIAVLTADLATLNASLTDLSNKLTNDYATKAELTNAINSAKDTINSTIDALTIRVQNLEAGLAEANGKININTTDVGTLKTDLSTLETWKTEAEVAIEALETLTGTQGTNISALQTAVAELQATMNTANGKIAAAENRIAALEDKVSALETAKTNLENAVSALQTAVADKADTATVNAAIAELQTAIEALEAVKNNYIGADDDLRTELEGKIETAKSEAITAANTALTTAKNELSQAIALKADTATVNAKVDALNTAIANAESVAKEYADTQDAALKAEMQTAIANAKSEAIGAAQLLVDNAKAELQTAIDTKADTTTVNAAIAKLQNAITALEATKDNYASADAALKLELEAAIERAKQEAIEASKGYIPYIGTNGNWWIGNTDTGVDANGIKGDTGATGNGIASITTSKENGITTVTIKFTDPNMADVVFTIEDGADGAKGDTGAQGEKGDKGNTGADGVGIAKIEKTFSDGNVDTYTITLTNGTTYTFIVTNGTNGTDGKDGNGGAIIIATAVGFTALISNIALIAWVLIKKKRLF